MLKFNIFHLYPDEMNLYGDLGNITTLVQRSEWRGIKADVTPVKRGDRPDFKSCDIIFMGGGQDRGQNLIAPDLRDQGATIKEEIEKGLPALTICGGYQLFGQYFKTKDGEVLEGISVFNSYTEGSNQRCIGNIVVDISIESGKWEQDSRFGAPSPALTTLVGFENHSGLTYLQDGTRPLGSVLIGFGNDGKGKTEGAVYKNAYGTYLHGPVLPKNPHFADRLILQALRKHYDSSVTLPDLDNTIEFSAHTAAIERAKKSKTPHL